ncbi:tRNA (5-methylaminomethyl-2-thiouridine)(34)-methyltransferase MnmD [Leptospira sp. 96542]|nr:tRNA (5-methylaminomethyl-2-thiouridine)(34)-methyltransferase MnmD [Leptospira sp. 96542]
MAEDNLSGVHLQSFEPSSSIFFCDGVPISREFDDVYFSVEGGIEETGYVFLNGNQIFDRWENTKNLPGKDSQFRIGELGFGTGLNFFVTLNSWKNHQDPPNIKFISLEKFPIEKDILDEMKIHFPSVTPWPEQMLNDYLKILTHLGKNPGSQIWKFQINHPKFDKSFFIELYFGDILETLPKFPLVDAWYLDGFAPSKNPAMWSSEVFSLLKEKSRENTSLATFTAAGFVKRGLEEAGFKITKRPGYGRKREMIVGRIGND